MADDEGGQSPARARGHILARGRDMRMFLRYQTLY
jgi:hypothetical protein